MRREEIKTTAHLVKCLLVDTTEYPAIGVTSASDTGEMVANLTLAYRHLEDASMRLGKAIQAFDGGVSVYDKSKVVGA